MQLADLTNNADIKTMRRMKQLVTSANQCLENGNMVAYQEWMAKARAKHNELKKNLGVEDIISVPGTCKQAVITL